MEKEPCVKFCRVSISCHQVIKLQSFESCVSDAITTNVQNISDLVFLAHFCKFYRTFI